MGKVTWLALLWLIPGLTLAEVQIMGPTYPIIEPDLLVVLKTRYQKLVNKQGITHFQSLIKERVMHHSDRPKPLGLPRTHKAKTKDFDPSIVLRRNVVDASGQIIIQQGTRVNPLDTVRLTQDLVFYNADDKTQVRWVKRYLSNNPNVKLVLVNGSIKSQVNYFKRPIYFDQFGRLTQRFGIEQVPAVVCQAGKSLRVKEVVA